MADAGGLNEAPVAGPALVAGKLLSRLETVLAALVTVGALLIGKLAARQVLLQLVGAADIDRQRLRQVTPESGLARKVLGQPTETIRELEVGGRKQMSARIR